MKFTSLNNKIVAITGTTSGTGFHAAKAVLDHGGVVLLLNRSSDRLQNMLKTLYNQYNKKYIISIECDLTSFDSVIKAANSINTICSKYGLYALCNNAGIMLYDNILTEDGFDIQIQTNHLSHFLLTKLVFKSLKLSCTVNGSARIINHTSVARLCTDYLNSNHFIKDAIDPDGNSNGIIIAGGKWKRYSQSKLANMVFTSCLYEQIQKKKLNIYVFAAHPGISSSNLMNHSASTNAFLNILCTLGKNLAQSVEEGAQGIIRGILDNSLESGKLLGPGKGLLSFTGDAQVYDLDLDNLNDNKKNLWEYSEKALNIKFNI